MWIKLQASCSSLEQATAFFEHRFGGNDPDPSRPDLRYISFSFQVPRRLSECVDHIANWALVREGMPIDWDSDEFRLVKGPYAWCETLLADCDCRGNRGRLDIVYCSDLGSLEDAARREAKSPNARRLGNIQSMRDIVIRRQVEQRNNPRTVVTEPSAQPQAEQFYCPAHREYHPYSEQVDRKLQAQLSAIKAQMRTQDPRGDTTFRTFSTSLAKHLRSQLQAQECADSFVAGGFDIPEVIYKYMPAGLIGNGPPNSLRTTQILALNDKMECNFVTMPDPDMDPLDFLTLIQSRIEGHLSIAVEEEELLERSLRFGDLRLSTFVQEYLNPQVGVVSMSTDLLVPTMWSHYAGNTGVVVGYDTEALRCHGYDLRPMHYAEIAPVYEPTRDDTIRLRLADLEEMEQCTRLGQESSGTPILASTELARMGAGWKNISRLLFTKGASWAYEKEVRLLVDLQESRDTGKRDDDGWPIKVIDLPPSAITEIYGSDSTSQEDRALAVEAARGENLDGLLVGQLSSHAFRMQKTVLSRY